MICGCIAIAVGFSLFVAAKLLYGKHLSEEYTRLLIEASKTTISLKNKLNRYVESEARSDVNEDRFIDDWYDINSEIGALRQYIQTIEMTGGSIKEIEPHLTRLEQESSEYVLTGFNDSKRNVIENAPLRLYVYVAQIQGYAVGLIDEREHRCQQNSKGRHLIKKWWLYWGSTKLSSPGLFMFAARILNQLPN